MTWGRVVLSVHLSNVSRLKSDKAGLEVSAARPSTPPPPPPPPLLVVRQLESKKSSSSLCPGRQAAAQRNSELDTDVLPCRPAADHAGLKMPGWQTGPYSKSGIRSEIQKAKNTTCLSQSLSALTSEAEQRKHQRFVTILGYIET